MSYAGRIGKQGAMRLTADSHESRKKQFLRHRMLRASMHYRYIALCNTNDHALCFSRIDWIQVESAAIR